MEKTEATVGDTVDLLSRQLYRYIITNADQMDAVLAILLHPHVRSFRVRAALGRDSWTNLMSELGLVPLHTPAPPVAAIYFLRGHRRAASGELARDIGYCGKASQLTSSSRGANSRLSHHESTIRRVSEGRARKTRSSRSCITSK